MKCSLIVLILLLLFSCDDNNSEQPDLFNIVGKWNLESFEDNNGVVHNKAYTIFVWYEDGLEFVGEQFYPRYDPSFTGTGVWKTDYQTGPGTFKLLNDNLQLSFEDTTYDYAFEVVDKNTIRLANNSVWAGTWVLVRDN